ncbi:putative DNA repair protein ruvB [Pseudomonas savastanoi pv. glycinea]|uniref:DNA repair protein ruvB n=3 Tax=Pseudomonas savastanoi TaxID=29438 RepID=A0ABR5LDI5_PSESG|nr:putative DNA repair protein ruvB [Pseudomonas savastanoi pv. glycinea]KPC44317.1 putative DNA repair protein ruvB [Pseudomonas savastanoi pv. glycinea]
MKLEADGVMTAWQLANADPKTIRQRYDVVLERTVRELTGEPCIELQEAEPDRQDLYIPNVWRARDDSRSHA